MKKFFNTRTVSTTLGLLMLSCVYCLPVLVHGEDSPKVYVSNTSGSYKPGDVIKISWTPKSTPVQNIIFIPSKKSPNNKGYYIYSNIDSSSPVLTNGYFNYTLSDYSIKSGSYYVGIGLSQTTTIDAKSSKRIKIESKPSLYFGTTDGSSNSVAIASGKSITLKWEASSVKNCKATSIPFNSKWNKNVKPTGTKTIRVTAPVTFYLTCQNNLGSVSTLVAVNTEAPTRSEAVLVPSTAFITTNFKLGTSRDEALRAIPSVTILNSSDVEPIYYRFVIKDQPSWINSGYNTAQMSLEPHGVAGVGAFTDPTMVSSPGTYKWNLQIEGNFANSPLVIPVTMNVTN